MDISAIKEYLLSLDAVSLPMLQKTFSLSYSEVVKLVFNLELQNVVVFISGFTYKVHKDCIIDPNGVASNIKKLEKISDDEETLIIALRECIKRGFVTISELRRRLSIGYAFAARLVDRLEKLRVINYSKREVLVSAQEFNARFGNRYKIDIG